MSVEPTVPPPSASFLAKKKGDEESAVSKLLSTEGLPTFGSSDGSTTASGLKRVSQQERINKMIEASATLAESKNPQCAACLRSAAPVLNIGVKIMLFIGPLYLWIYGKIYLLYTILPTNVIKMIFGVTLCFYGGPFLASFAAIEAFRKMGFERTIADLTIVYEDIQLIRAASTKDDDKDEDGDGMADVDQISAADLAKRKMMVAMTAVKKPELLQQAVGSLWASYLAVLATLKLEFARTTAIALALAEMIKMPIMRVVSPLMGMALGPDLKHWVDTIVDSTINILAMIFAWYLQMIISAFYSGLRGGTMFANAMFDLLNDKGWINMFPDFIVPVKPYDPNESYLDEIVGYTLAAVGFGTQIFSGFAIQFPINIILMPFTLLEWVLRWQITYGAPTTG
jgi:hypothetical protein